MFVCFSGYVRCMVSKISKSSRHKNIITQLIKLYPELHLCEAKKALVSAYAAMF